MKKHESRAKTFDNTKMEMFLYEHQFFQAISLFIFLSDWSFNIAHQISNMNGNKLCIPSALVRTAVHRVKFSARSRVRGPVWSSESEIHNRDIAFGALWSNLKASLKRIDNKRKFRNSKDTIFHEQSIQVVVAPCPKSEWRMMIAKKVHKTFHRKSTICSNPKNLSSQFQRGRSIPKAFLQHQFHPNLTQPDRT